MTMGRRLRASSLAVLLGIVATVAPGPVDPGSPLGQGGGAVLGAEAASECALPQSGAVGAIDFTHYQRPIGEVRGLMIFVDFPDAPAGGSTEDAAEVLLPEAQDWYASASYGRLELAIQTVDQWFRMPSASTSYGWARGLSYDQHAAYIADAVAAADTDVDFAGYDVYYVVANREATAISHSPTFVGGPLSEIEADGATIGLAVTFGADMWGWGFGVLNHETGHMFGLPDLYAYDGVDQHRFVGGWDLMGNIAGPQPDHFAWFKWQFGWLLPEQVTCLNTPGTTEVVLASVADIDGRKLIVLRTSSAGLTAAELRTNDGVDAGGCDEGVLIYRIYNGMASGAGPIRVVDANPGGPPPPGCVHELDDAAWDVGDGPYVDVTGGIRIEVLSRDGLTARVRVTRTSSWTPPDVRHARRLTLTFGSRSATGMVTATARLSVPDGHSSCAASRAVLLQGRRSGAWVTIRTLTTDSSGRASYRWRAPAGSYRLVAAQAILAGRPRNVCLAITSSTRTRP